MSTTSAGPVLKQGIKKAHQQAELEQLEQLNSRLRNISEKIIPASPYILTVPEAPKFTLSPQHAADFSRGTPFAPNEELLQYISFLNRDFDHGCLRAFGGWDNEKGELMTFSPNGQFAKSGTTTPKQGQIASKKMSLADYKNKKAGEQPGVKELTKPNGQEIKHEGANSFTRSIGVATSAVDEAMSRPAEASDRPLSKKQRTTPPPPATIKSNTKTEVSALPKLRLPSLLSPTLPAAVEEGLIKLDESAARGVKPEDKKTESTGVISSKKQPPSSQPDLPRSSQGIKIKSAASAVEKNRVRGVSQPQKNKPSANTSNPSSQVSDPPSQFRKKPQEKADPGAGVSSKPISAGAGGKSRKGQAAPGASNAASTSIEEPKKKSKVVVLKIPKARRKDASRLLQMPPVRTQPKHLNTEETPRSLSEKRNTATPSPDIRRKVLEGPGVEGPQSKGKRTRPEEDQVSRAPPPKRQKHPNNPDLGKKPRTPNPPAFKSPSMSNHGSGQKLQDSKSNPSRRLDIGDADVKTPQGSTRAGTPLAPNSIERASRDGRSTSNTSMSSSLSGKSEEFNAWRTEQIRYLKLGRTLKHEADALFVQCEEKEQPQIEKKSIAVGAETVLCFMLAYTMADEMNGSRSWKSINVQTWDTIFPYLHKVKRKTVGYTLLHGLLLQLEAVCRNSILVWEIERVAQSEVANLSTAEADKPTPETGASATLNGTGAKPPAQLETMKVKGRISENSRLSQQLWTEGAFELSIEDLQQSFPDSWKSKARAPLARTKEKLVLGALNGDFYLPMSSVTTGIEAVRAGWSLLGEWCRKEEVDWVGKLGL